MIKAEAQHTIDIPEFKNININDTYPSSSFTAIDPKNFDIVISLNRYSAWGPDYSVKILTHLQSGWYKFEKNISEKLSDTFSVCYTNYKIPDSIGMLIWNSLLQNHLFEMKDGRQIEPFCTTTDTIKHTNGRLEFMEIFHSEGVDGPEYEFEIFTKVNYKKLYFYSPQGLVDICLAPERRWILNCINVFEKYLGN